MTESHRVDIAVIGSGPGGYIAAIRAAQRGKQVMLIEKGDLGGVCLNVGCIPTKTLLANAAVLHTVRKAQEFGIETGAVRFHYDKMKARKDQVVAKIRASLEGLIKANRITIVRGQAQFTAPFSLKVTGANPCLVEAGKVIIATGSIPMDVKAFPCDHKRILNSTSILELTETPKRLAIVGGGYIGCEFATLFAELGTEVTILEALPSILTAQGKTVSQFMTKAFSARGIQIRTNVMVEAIENRGASAYIRLKGGESVEADYALVAVGRRVFTEGLALEKAGLALNERGAIPVNAQMETAVGGIFAVGDVTGQWMLAHAASHQGVIAADAACGHETGAHEAVVPAIVFTSPEIGTVGLTVEQAQEKGYRPTVGMFPFQALGKGQAALETEGFAQIVADEKTGQILGALVIGHEASNLIAEMALAIQNELTLEAVEATIHAHPTVAEAWHEAAAIALGMPLNFPPKAKK
jgi:dihydrolipoamide dehydrogenase